MHPFHMLGKINASPPVYSLSFYWYTLIGLCILLKLLDDKGRSKTRLNGGSSLLLLFFLYKLNYSFYQRKIKKIPVHCFNFIKTKLITGGQLFKISDTSDNLNEQGQQMDISDNNENFNNNFPAQGEEIIELSRNNPVPNRIPPRQLPGVYMVLCLHNNKRYYGQSVNVSSRLSQHKSRLRRNIHEVPELQRDWNLYGETNFQFSAIYLSKDYTKIEREALEIELIARHYNICYNNFTKMSRKKENNPFWGHSHSEGSRTQISQSLSEHNTENPPEGLAIQLKGALYPSISEASRQTKHSRDTIRRWLNDPSNFDCIQIDVSQKSRPNGGEALILERKRNKNQDIENRNTGLAKSIQLNGVKYRSVGEAARQTGYSLGNIQRLLRTDKENCFYL